MTYLDLGAAEIEDRFPPGSLDAVVSRCLAMSEMSPDEQDYALRVAYSRLTPGGAIVIADETPPAGGRPGSARVQVAAMADRAADLSLDPDQRRGRRPYPPAGRGRRI